VIRALLLAATFVPIHGTVIGTLPGNAAIVRIDDVPAIIPAQTRRLRIASSAQLPSGTGVDGFLEQSTRPWTLDDAVPAGPFAPGMPDQGRVQAVDVGKLIPSAWFVDQQGLKRNLGNAFAGRTVLLSFVFTRCPDRDICPAISGKYAYLQAHLDSKRFALVEITLDPQYDSPAILRAYGEQFGAIGGRWYLLTSTGSITQRVLDEFGINSLRISAANFIHNDKLYIVTPRGRIAYVVETAGWDPDAVIAEASAVAGMASNPLERFKLSLIASVVALCGGSQFAGVVLLEIALFFVVLGFVAAGLWIVARILWVHPEGVAGKTRGGPR
jgi:protein SCO1